jgi:hypothetical protein
MSMLLALSIGNRLVQIPDNSNIPGQLLDDPANCGATFLSNGLNLFLVIGVATAVIFITWSGVKWIISGGDKQKLAQAKNQLYWAIIGIITMFCGYLIVSIIGAIFNVPIFDFSRCKGSGSNNTPVQTAPVQTASVANSNSQASSGQSNNSSLTQDALNFLKNGTNTVCQNVWVPYFLRVSACPSGQSPTQ